MSLKSKLVFLVKSLILLASCDQNKPKLIYNSNLDINKQYYVVLMAGQSNMVGLGDVKDLDTFELPNNVMYFNHSTNTYLKKLLNHKFGPEVGLAGELSKHFPDLNFIFIKYAIGGSSINEWLPNVESKIERKVDFGNLYGKFKKMTDSIIKGYNTKHLAFLWMQGETDARYNVTSKDYEKNLKSLIRNVREDFNRPNLPVLFGKINSHTENHDFVMPIQNAQNKTIKTIPNTYLINTDLLDKQNDNVHYSSKGLLLLGKAYGEILCTILKGEIEK